MTPEALEQLASRISSAADGYRLVAEQMRERGIVQLAINGIDTVEQALIRRLNGNLLSAQRALLNYEQDLAKAKRAAEDGVKYEKPKKGKKRS